MMLSCNTTTTRWGCKTVCSLGADPDSCIDRQTGERADRRTHRQAGIEAARVTGTFCIF